MSGDVLLERVRLYVRQAISDEAIEADVSRSIRSGDIVVTLYACLFAERVVEDVVVRWPATWLEAVRERFLPARLRARWPVRYAVRVVGLQAAYRDWRPRVPEAGKTIPIVTDWQGLES